MPWIYHRESDSLLIVYLRPQGCVVRKQVFSDGVVEVDGDGEPVRVTVHQASRFCSVEDLLATDRRYVEGEPLHSPLMAAGDLGMRPDGVRQEILSGGIPMVKIGESWGIRPYVLPIYRVALRLRKEAARLSDGDNPS